MLELAAHDRATFDRMKVKVDDIAASVGIPNPSGGLKDQAYSYWRSVNRAHVPHWSDDQP
jgi:hypothetical protein